MSHKVTISGCAPWDGAYTFDHFTMTNRELNRIKTITAADDAAPIRAAELVEALYMNDRAAVVALAVVVLARAGKKVDADDLWDAAIGSIRLELDVGDDADPPTTPSSDASSGDEPSEPTSSSGAGSASGGD